MSGAAFFNNSAVFYPISSDFGSDSSKSAQLAITNHVKTVKG
jgi:hypothetical protein